MSADGAGGLSRRGVLASAAALALALPALAAAGKAGAAKARAAARTHVIVIDKMKFGPAPANVKVGDTVTWQNRDMFRHTATARNRAFDLDLPPGASGSAVMRTAGTIAYYCRYHPAMQAEISVSAT